MIGGLCGKVGAALAIVPDPIVGATNLCMLGLMPGFSIRILRQCDITSLRNLSVYGLTLTIGMTVPYYVKANPQCINTGKYCRLQIFCFSY